MSRLKQSLGGRVPSSLPPERTTEHLPGGHGGPAGRQARGQHPTVAPRSPHAIQGHMQETPQRSSASKEPAAGSHVGLKKCLRVGAQTPSSEGGRPRPAPLFSAKGTELPAPLQSGYLASGGTACLGEPLLQGLWVAVQSWPHHLGPPPWPHPRPPPPFWPHRGLPRGDKNRHTPTHTHRHTAGVGGEQRVWS